LAINDRFRIEEMETLTMKVTVCQMRDGIQDFERDFFELVEHAKEERSELVLLPEMPFAPWVAWTNLVDQRVWEAAVEAHDTWMDRLVELAPRKVLGSRPSIVNGNNHNDGFLWDPSNGYQFIHRKVYLPDEPGFWEATWYHPGERAFQVFRAENIHIGVQLCTELWFTEHARAYARQGIHILAIPRATELATADKWLAGGRAAAVMSGAYCLSSNRTGVDEHDFEWGGLGWIVDPDGVVLGVTTNENPFITQEIELSRADLAKKTYPRYIRP
jgi:N-carbamoylputrescine amidase